MNSQAAPGTGLPPRLERQAGKLARAVLRGRGVSNDLMLPDTTDAEIRVESGRRKIMNCLTMEL